MILKFPLGMQWRIGLAYTLLIFVAMGIVSLYLVTFVRARLYQDLQTRVEREAALVGGQMESIMQSSGDPRPSIQDTASRLARDAGARIAVIGRDGTVLADSGPAASRSVDAASLPEVQAALAGQVAHHTRPGPGGQEQAYAAAPIRGPAGVDAVVQLSVSTDTVQQNVRRIVTTVAVSAAILALLLVLLAFLIARRTTRSIRAVTYGARRLAAGDLEHRVHALSIDETRELAEAFNSMAATLRERLTELNDERNTLATVLTTMRDGVVAIDHKGQISMANPAAERLLGVELQPGKKQRFLEVVRDYEIQQLVTAAASRRTPQQAVVELLRQRVLLAVTAVPLENPDAEGVLLALHDLSEARRVNTMRREFVANVSHELRTPLAGIKASVETLDAGALEDPPAARSFLARIDREVDRMTRLVQELMELSRLETNQAPLSLEPTSISALVRETVDRYGARAKAAGVTVNVDIPERLPLVVADSERLERVVSNLLDNAVKFTPAGGAVTIAARADAGKVLVSVSDTGPGIPEEHLPHIFERFYKVDRARNDDGVGLGLAIAKHIVEAHRGEMTVASKEGQGSTFTFSIPIHHQAG